MIEKIFGLLYRGRSMNLKRVGRGVRNEKKCCQAEGGTNFSRLILFSVFCDLTNIVNMTSILSKKFGQAERGANYFRLYLFPVLDIEQFTIFEKYATFSLFNVVLLVNRKPIIEHKYWNADRWNLFWKKQKNIEGKNFNFLPRTVTLLGLRIMVFFVFCICLFCFSSLFCF